MIFYEKSQPAPIGLEEEKKKVNGSYRLEEVLIRLQKDFYNKCYICELDELTAINVEHITPHKKDVNLKFDWNNLLLACSHCNNTKLAEYEDILNCTIESDQVESSIRLEKPTLPRTKVKVVAQNQNPNTLQTVALLDAVYNGTGKTKMKTIEAENLLSKLNKELLYFQEIIIDYYEAVKFEEEDNKIKFKDKIRRSLHKAAPFTSFKRWLIRDHEELNKEFGDLLVIDK